MSPRALTIVLAVSVALNLFAVAAGVTVFVGQARVEQRVEEERRPRREGSVMEVVRTLDPAVQDRVRPALRASALAARPDFREARQARREAIALAAGPAMDAGQVAALLARSRAAEARGRERIETDSIAMLATLEAGDREALSIILNRRGGRDRSRRDGDDRAAAERPN